MGLVALFQIAHEQQRRPGDVAGMIGRRLWNRIPDDVRRRIVGLALDVPELSPRELAVRFTETEKYFVSEASVYRLLKSLDLITSPAFIVIKAADEFRDKTTAINQLWQTDFTYLKVIGWGWMYLSTILDDYSRYIIAWKLCSTMKSRDVWFSGVECSPALPRTEFNHRPVVLNHVARVNNHPLDTVDSHSHADVVLIN